MRCGNPGPDSSARRSKSATGLAGLCGLLLCVPVPVVIVEYDARWPSWFARYRDELLAVDSGFFDCIEHIGSTSVPGLAAKPIIDIMVGVSDPVLIDVSAEPVVMPGDGQNVVPAGPRRHVAMVNAIKGIGYAYRGENTIPGRLLFGHRDVTPPCHIHLVQIAGEFWRRHLLFRDYLRAHPAEARAYADLKHGLADKFRGDRQTYTESKTEFITNCERKAEKWRAGQSMA